MKIRVAGNRKEREHIASVMKDFYAGSPSGFAGPEENKAHFAHYIKVIEHWTPAGGHILDFGAGKDMSPLLALHRRGFHVTGCDLYNENKMESLRDLLGGRGPQLAAIHGTSLPFPDESFDTVASGRVMEHLVWVEETLCEMSRILKPGGRIIIIGPNISGPHRALIGTARILFRKQRYWQFEKLSDCATSFFRFLWMVAVLKISRRPKFTIIFPYMKNGRIHYGQSDDDAVHLNAPLSYKNWFLSSGYRVREFNNHSNGRGFVSAFNRVFPSLATYLQIVAEKGGQRR